MELNCAHIVHMSSQSEHALLHFVVPYFDKVVVTSTNEHGLSLMEVDSSNGAWSMENQSQLLKSFNAYLYGLQIYQEGTGHGSQRGECCRCVAMPKSKACACEKTNL